MNYKLDTSAGNQFQKVAEQASQIASMPNFKGDAVEFEFNGIICLVTAKTNLELLWRDYANAHRMEWKTVGPDCLKQYTKEIQDDLDRRNKLAEEREEQQRREWEAKDKAERKAFEAKVKGIDLELSDAEGWQKARTANSDGYGSSALDYAEGWAKLMQVEISKGKSIAECYEYTQKGLGFLGITGFQFGCAVSTLSQTWKYGEELRKHHNQKYGISEDKKGTANPALMTLS